jgi:hypothetical protein
MTAEATTPTTQSQVGQKPLYVDAFDNRERNWRKDVVARMTSADWRVWLSDRVHGRDASFGYGPNEFPGETAWLFERAAAFCLREGISLKPARVGAEEFLAGLDPEKEAHGILIDSLTAARLLADRESNEGAEVVAGWIKSEKLLAGDKPDRELQRYALGSLAVLQRCHADGFMDIWDKYFVPNDQNDKYYYVAAAFIGKALAASAVPVDDLKELLRFSQEAGREMGARAAINVFWREWSKLKDLAEITKRFDSGLWTALWELSPKSFQATLEKHFEHAELKYLAPQATESRRVHPVSTWGR